MAPSTESDITTDDEAPEGRRTSDAREIDGEPLGEIVGTLEDLPADGTLLLVDSFEPVPLYDVLDRREFEHQTE